MLPVLLVAEACSVRRVNLACGFLEGRNRSPFLPPHRKRIAPGAGNLPKTDSFLARFMDVSKGRVVAIGNVDATKFEKTTREAMVADVRRCIDAAARHSAFILSTSCEIPPKSSPEIVKWFMDAAREYGRYERIFDSAEPAPAG